MVIKPASPTPLSIRVNIDAVATAGVRYDDVDEAIALANNTEFGWADWCSGRTRT